jgi:hypothetical protein
MPQPLEKPVADGYQATVGGSNVHLGTGDPVKLASDGTVELCAATDACYGIIVGVKRYWDGSVIRSGSVVPGASTGGGLLHRQSRVLVIPAHWGIWEVDVDDKTTATTEAAYQAFLEENVEISNTRTEYAEGFRARSRLDISLHATTAALVWRIVGIAGNQSNQSFAESNVRLLVAINKCQWAGWAATTIAGV